MRKDDRTVSAARRIRRSDSLTSADAPRRSDVLLLYFHSTTRDARSATSNGRDALLTVHGQCRAPRLCSALLCVVY